MKRYSVVGLKASFLPLPDPQMHIACCAAVLERQTSVAQ